MGNFIFNPLLKKCLQKSPTAAEISGGTVTQEEFDQLAGVTSNIQEQINAITAGQSYSDVSATTWAEFVQIVSDSITNNKCYRIHIRAALTVTANATLNLTNCVIEGHYSQIIFGSHSISLTGTFGYFNNTWFVGNDTNTPAFILVGASTSWVSCQYYFDGCRLQHFADTQNGTFIKWTGSTNNSCHAVLHQCKVNGNDGASAYTLLFNAASSVAGSNTLTFIACLNTNKTAENNKLAFTSNNTNDGICLDASINWDDNYTKPSAFRQYGLAIYENAVFTGTFSANGSTATGTNAAAFGLSTTAAGNYQLTAGRYNVADTSNQYLLILGNGTASTAANALTVDWLGNVTASGTITDGTGNTVLSGQTMTESEWAAVDPTTLPNGTYLITADTTTTS